MKEILVARISKEEIRTLVNGLVDHRIAELEQRVAELEHLQAKNEQQSPSNSATVPTPLSSSGPHDRRE